MRLFVPVVLSLLVAAGCSSGGNGPSTRRALSCDLLTETQVVALVNGPVEDPAPALVGGLPVCKWPVESGGFVQVGSLSAADWAQGLPDLIRMLERSPLVKDDADREKLNGIRRLIESEDALTPTGACSAFASMLELQGQPRGTQQFVSVTPTNEDPRAMNGQMCSAGRFTTVSLINEDGLTKPLPGEVMVRTMRAAHRQGLG